MSHYLVDRLSSLLEESDSRTIEELIESEVKEDHIIKEARYHDGLWFLSTGEMGIGLKGPEDLEVSEGDTFTLLGDPFRGVVGWLLNGVVIDYKTPWEYFESLVTAQASRDRDVRERFAEEKQKMDEAYERLPKVMQARVDRFRKQDPGFRASDEFYEVFILEQALVIAEYIETMDIPKGDVHAAVKSFAQFPWEEQKQLVPKLSGEHSGNTFYSACAVASAYLRGEEL